MTEPTPESTSPTSEDAVSPSAGGAAGAPEGPAGSTEASPESETPAGETPAGESAEGGANATTYVILAAVVVILAIVLAIQVPTIQTQLRLRKIQAGLAQPKPIVDEAALEALTAEGPALLTHLADELEVGGPERERFRIFLIGRLLAPMEGEEATQVLMAMVGDKSPAVRANVYDQIANRAKSKLMDTKQARAALAAAWSAEQDDVAKGVAASSSVRLGDERAIWPLIWSLRHTPPRGSHLVPTFVETLKLALGPKVALDLNAPPEEVKRQMLAIEAAYQAQGGKIPPGQDLKSVLEKSAAQASGGAGQ